MKNTLTIQAPTSGQIVPLVDVKDPVFASKAMGEGVAILSETGIVTSPISGTVSVVNPSKHAYGIVGDHGLEVLIHIGIDTVELKGQGFESTIKEGQKIQVGDTLAKVDLALLKAKKYEPIVILVITNSAQFDQLEIEKTKQVKSGDTLIRVPSLVTTSSTKTKASTTQQLAQDIMENVGGVDNVAHLEHCATRLRFNLKDNSKANKVALEQLDVLKVMEAGGQLQVVIGPKVATVFEEIQRTNTLIEDTENSGEKQKPLDVVFNTISGSFTPLIPVLCATGLIKALIAILEQFDLISTTSGTFSILSAAGNALFYFFPVMLGFTAALKMKASPYVGALIGASLLEPNFTSLIDSPKPVTFLGIPVLVQDYSSTVFAIFVAIVIYAQLEKLLKKLIPELIHSVFVPFLSLVIMVPLTVLIFGPFGVYVSDLLESFIQFLIQLSPVLTGFVLGAIWIPVVIFGLHWAIIPLMIANLSAYGYDSILAMTTGTLWVTGGIALGVLLKTKDQDLKKLASVAMVPCFSTGILEPIIYGILFPYKKTFAYTIIMSGIAGGLVGLFNVRATTFTGGIFTVHTYLSLPWFLLIIAISVFGSAALVLFFGYETKKKNNV